MNMPQASQWKHCRSPEMRAREPQALAHLGQTLSNPSRKLDGPCAMRADLGTHGGRLHPHFFSGSAD
jgi:hypothetical protein